MHPLRVLYVDDEADIREIVEISLSLDPAFAIHSCSSGEDAIAALAARPTDLILLDVMMPGMDGPATLTRLREGDDGPDVPVIFLTARAEASERDRLLALGAIGVIAKPFDPMTLAALVRRYAPAAETRLAALRARFLESCRGDAATISSLSREVPQQSETRLRIKSVAHAVTEAAGIYGFPLIGAAAAALETALGADDPDGGERTVEDAITTVVASIEDSAREFSEA